MTKKQAIKVLTHYSERYGATTEFDNAIETAIRLLSKPAKRRIPKPKLQPCMGCGGKSNRKRYRQCDNCHEKMMKQYFEIKGKK